MRPPKNAPNWPLGQCSFILSSTWISRRLGNSYSPPTNNCFQIIWPSRTIAVYESYRPNPNPSEPPSIPSSLGHGLGRSRLGLSLASIAHCGPSSRQSFRPQSQTGHLYVHGWRTKSARFVRLQTRPLKSNSTPPLPSPSQRTACVHCHDKGKNKGAPVDVNFSSPKGKLNL